MNQLFIEQTKNSPRLLFDPIENKFEIMGESRPENVRSFYEPILHWVNDFHDFIAASKKIPSQLNIKIRLGYFNSSSAKFIFDLLHKFHQFESLGTKPTVLWLYEDGDDDMKQAGLDLSEMLDFPFQYETVND